MKKVRERELKFAIDTKGIVTLQDHPLIRNTSKSVRRERSYYFDTAGFRLCKAGFILRLRKSDERLTQTIKRFPRRANMLFDRGEWECAVTDQALNFEAVATTPLGELVSDMTIRDAIGIRFETLVDRTCWRVEWDGASIALTLDEGKLVAGSVEVSICEIELELVTGKVSALFEAATELARIIALRPSTTSKANRGVALAKAVGFQPAKAESIELERAIYTNSAARLIITSGIDHLCSNAAVLSLTPDPDALHQAHIATRRLRTATRIFQSHVNVDKKNGWNKAVVTLRELADILGQARDLDVLISRFGREPSIHARLAQRRDAAYDRVVTHLGDPAHGQCLIQLLAALQGMPELTGSDGGAVEMFAKDCLDRLRRRLLKAAHTMPALSPEDLHRVRVSAKRLRYACEFFESLYGGQRRRQQYRATIRSLEALQSALGDINDLNNAALVLGPEYHISAEQASKLLAASESALAQFHRSKLFWR